MNAYIAATAAPSIGDGGTLWEYLALYAFHLGKMAAAEHYATNHTEPLNGKWARKLI